MAVEHEHRRVADAPHICEAWPLVDRRAAAQRQLDTLEPRAGKLLADPDAMARRALCSACTGNCSQGRMCDCVPDVEPERPPMTDSDRGLILFLATICLSIFACGLGFLYRTFS